MADEAAGAVRRTPRPAPEPDADELVNQTQMLGFGVERGVATLSLKPPREIVLAWVDAARAMLGEAPNYSETRVDFPTEKAEMEVSAAGEYERFVFTVQRAGKLTPHEARRKAEAERDALQARLDEPCDECRRLSRRCEKFHGQVRTAESERDGLKARHDKLSSAVRDVLESLKGSPCSFWACPGPDEPLTPMATCNVCAPQIELRAALQGDQPTEPRHELILKSGLSGCTGACSCGTWHGGGRHEPPSRVAYRWDAEHLTSLPLEQPTGEADRG